MIVDGVVDPLPPLLVAARIAGKAGDLGKIEGQIMRQQPMPELGLGLRDHRIRTPEAAL